MVTWDSPMAIDTPMAIILRLLHVERVWTAARPKVQQAKLAAQEAEQHAVKCLRHWARLRSVNRPPQGGTVPPRSWSSTMSCESAPGVGAFLFMKVDL